jgi:SAM-dependent methyltransferase
MAQASAFAEFESARLSVRSPLVPRYVDVGGGRVLAQFGKDASASLELSCDRSRAYPGLITQAPRTDAFYRAFAQVVAGKSVLDVGCGAGAGLVHLNAASNVIAVDCAEEAVWFASHAQPHVRVERADVTRDVLPHAEVAILVDVLGEVSRPRDVLRQVGASVGEGGLICIAEPHASIAQELTPPMQRAFSRPQLETLLSDSGYVIVEWISEKGFLAVVARRVSTDWTRGIEAADLLCAEGLKTDALELLLEPPQTSAEGAAPAWYLRIAEICIERGDGDGALKALMEVQEIAPGDARVLASLAELSLGMGALSDAARFSVAAAQRDPANPNVALSLALSVGQNLTPAESIALWSNAARLAPAAVDVAVSLARTAAAHDAYHVGITALERVREYHPCLPADFHLTLGWMYLMSNRLEDAQMQCRMAALVEPENPATAELMAALGDVRPQAIGQA